MRADEAEAPGARPSPLPPTDRNAPTPTRPGGERHSGGRAPPPPHPARDGSERADADPTEGRRASTDPANRRSANGKGVSWMVLTKNPPPLGLRQGKSAKREGADQGIFRIKAAQASESSETKAYFRQNPPENPRRVPPTDSKGR